MKLKMQKVKGRVLDTWTEGTEEKEGDSTYCVELLCSAERRIFVSPETLDLKKGMIVELRLTKRDVILSVDILSTPVKPWSAENSDSLRWNGKIGARPRGSVLWQRQEILKEIRNDLYEEGFLEVETPLVVKGTCPDISIQTMSAEGGYLVTSTEYQLKRMFVGGFEKLFTLTKNFRANDRGRFHSSEFTMLEWARAYGTLEEIEEDTVRFVRKAFRKLHPGKTSLNYLGKEIDLCDSPWERLTVREALERYLNLKNLPDYSLQTLLKSVDNAHLKIPENFRKDVHLLLTYLLDQVQPFLGTRTPTFLKEWPAFMTSSAEIDPKNPELAQRSELFIAGIEIADGFPFLRDASLQRSFFEREAGVRQNEGKPMVQVDLKYIQALEEGIPPGAGMALGMDRLVMALTQSETLAETQPFSWDEL